MISYPDLIERILLQPRLVEKLLPKEPLNWELPDRIAKADDDALTGGREIADPSLLRIVRATLLYAVDALDAAHRIFQDEKSDIGSYGHGMMHRREGDFDNARYWFRRAGSQPFFQRLHRQAAEVSPTMARQPSWDAYLFTGECEQARFGAEEKSAELSALQRLEMECLLEYSWRHAVTC